VADARADIFALGVVAWQCLTGKVLYDVKGDLVELHALIKKPVTPPSQLNKLVPPTLDRVVLKALALDKDARFQTAEAFLRELEKVPGPVASQKERSDLLCAVFAKRREEFNALIQKASAEDARGFEARIPTERVNPVSVLSEQDTSTLRAPPSESLSTEDKTVPGGFHEIDTTPAPSVIHQRPAAARPPPPPKANELWRHWPWAVGLALLGAVLGWVLAHGS
jgi:serine/threonine protein kinase